MGCCALVSQGTLAKVAALRRACPQDQAALAKVLIDVGGAPGTPYDTAREVLARYLVIKGSPLPAGCHPSNEQWAVIKASELGKNILCRAVAGAGKTTTLLLCAARAPETNFLAVTYNKRLQVDVARRAQPNVTVMTYHAAAGKSYGTLVRNDEQFRRYVRAAPESPLRFDVLLVDESQDMAVEYFALVRHLLAANPGARMIVVGDELQSINEYRGAHPGFLTEAPALYRDLAGESPAKGREWVSCRLSISHRLTPATAAFVNAHLYRAEVIVGGNRRDADRPPVYIAAAGKEAVARALAAATKDAIAEFGAEGVFVLAPSVRDLASKQSPVAELVRRHLAGVPVFVAGDDARIDESLTRGKLAILSFNAVKGCERPCVIVVGLDETYFKFYNREWKDHRRLPNILTVAATRAISRLVVVAGAKDTLRSVDHARLAALADVRGAPARPRVRAPPKPRKTNVSVTQLVRHLHPETVRDAMALVYTAAAPDEEPRDCPRVEGHVKFGAASAHPLTEDLLFVYGTLAPVLAEVARRGGSDFGAGLESPEIVATPEEVEPFGNQITEDEYAAYPPQFWELVSGALASDSADRSPAEWAVLAVAHHAIRDGRHHIARQVTHYDWVNGAALTAAHDIVLRALAGLAGDFEVRTPRVTIGLKTILGVADFVERKSAEKPAGIVWEFKLGELCEEHELQLACYLALRGGGEGRLMSILCRETRVVAVNEEDALPLLTILAERATAAARPVAQIVADFDAGLDPAAAGEGEVDEVTSAVGAWTLDDAF